MAGGNDGGDITTSRSGGPAIEVAGAQAFEILKEAESGQAAVLYLLTAIPYKKADFAEALLY